MTGTPQRHIEMMMLFLYLSLFSPVVASTDCRTPGCAAAPRQVSLLQVQAQGRVTSALTEASSVHEVAQGHSASLAKWQTAHAAAIEKRRALKKFDDNLLLVQRRVRPEGHPNSSV